MTEPVLTKEGQEALNSILNLRPPITRERQKKKYSRILSLLMTEQGVKEAGKDLVMEAANMIESKALTPLFEQMEDPDKFQKEFRGLYNDKEKYYALPRVVKRWDTVPSKPAKRPDEMKVTAICASARKGGNTEVLIDEALRGAKDSGAKVEKIRLQSLKLNYCIGCRKCKDPGFEPLCSQKDDIYEVNQKIVDSDAIIIGFPIYTGGACAQLDTLRDRWDCFVRFSGKGFLEPGRRAMVIGVWGYPSVDGYDDMTDWIILILKILNIETVEAISANGFEGILHGLDDEGKALILRYPKELEKAYLAGKSLVTGE